MNASSTARRSSAVPFVALAIVALWLAGCGSTQVPESQSIEDRRAEAARLRANVPSAEVTLPKGDGTDAATKTEGSSGTDSSAGTTAVPTPVAEAGSIVLGEYSLVSKKPILDGDTIKVNGLDSSLRLLGIDTEETFKKDDHRSAAMADFDGYAAERRGSSPFPVKYGTPAGEKATEYAVDFFSGKSTVRLEYDDLKRQRGVFGRYLVYVFVQKGGEWVNYNVECVREGWSPYFVKYGYSRRFHDEFVAAEAEAKAAKRGIWGTKVEHYPDYDERLVWWHRRAESIAKFERDYDSDETFFQLGVDSEWDRMANYLGQSVTVFGTIGEMKVDESPYLIRISHKRFNDFTVVAFDKPELDALAVEQYDGEYIYVTGVLSTYRDRYQFKAADVETIWTE